MPKMPSLTIFIKSWLQDLNWLEYALRFIECNWIYPRTEVVVVLDEDCADAINFDSFGLDLTVYFVQPWADGYSHAMWIKTKADLFSQTDLILLTDSDCMLEYRSDIDDLMCKGRPYIPYLTYEEHNRQHPYSPWQKVTRAAFLEEPVLHYMGREPILYHRNTFPAMRAFLHELHGKPYDVLVRSEVPFDYLKFGEHPITLMDYDFLGTFAHKREADLYEFRHLHEMPVNKWKQHHSWTQNPEDQGVHKVLQAAFSKRLRDCTYFGELARPPTIVRD